MARKKKIGIFEDQNYKTALNSCTHYPNSFTS